MRIVIVMWQASFITVFDYILKKEIIISEFLIIFWVGCMVSLVSLFIFLQISNTLIHRFIPY